MLAAAVALSLAATGAQAATKSDLHKSDVAKLKQSYQMRTAAAGQADMAHRRHAEFMAAGADTTLLMRTKRGSRGVTNYRYRQAHRGVPIFGEDVVVSEDSAGNVRGMFGNLVSGLESDIASTRPALSKAQALVVGKRAGMGNGISGMLTERESIRYRGSCHQA